jgi:hypothetical protein
MKHILAQSIALLLFAGIAAVASQQVVETSAASNTICSSIPYVKVVHNSNASSDVLPLRSIEDCLASLRVDTDNMIAHIRALNKVFSHS